MAVFVTSACGKTEPKAGGTSTAGHATAGDTIRDAESTADTSGNGSYGADADGNAADHYYVTTDGSVGLCDYTALSYHLINTEVTEEDIAAKMNETLDYFNNVLWLNVTEVTDDLVKKYYQYNSVDELKMAYYEVIKEQKEEDAFAAYREEIVTQLVEGSVVYADLTEESADYYNSLMAHYKALAFAEGISTEEYAASTLNLNKEQFETKVAADALEMATREKVVLAVAEAEGYMVTHGEYNKRIGGYMEYYGYTDEAAFKNDLSEDFINENMLMDVTVDNLLARSEPISYE